MQEQSQTAQKKQNTKKAVLREFSSLDDLDVEPSTSETSKENSCGVSRFVCVLSKTRFVGTALSSFNQQKKGRVTHRHDWTWAFGWQSFQWASGISTMTSRWLLVMNGDVIKWAISPGSNYTLGSIGFLLSKGIGKEWKRYEQMHFPRHEWMFIQICFIHLMAAIPAALLPGQR